MAFIKITIHSPFMKNTISIIKRSGEIEDFNLNKLKTSLRRSAVDEQLILQIANEVESNLREGMTTKQVYKLAYKMLKGKNRVSASKYKLKKALMQLGPSGFPFEKLVGHLLSQEGFRTEVGVMVQGHCVQHEVDVIAKKEADYYMIECKYHSNQGRFCDVKVPLYIQSRFLDVKTEWKKHSDHQSKQHKGWVYTNTRFTKDAIDYGSCVDLGLTSWDYLAENGLRERIDRSGLHPITALTTLTKYEKTVLLDKGIVICKELLENPGILEDIGIALGRIKNIVIDLEELCKPLQKLHNEKR